MAAKFWRKDVDGLGQRAAFKEKGKRRRSFCKDYWGGH